MEVFNEKEVYFDQYCHKCRFENTPNGDLPCDECLARPSNTNSHKPLYFKEKEV